MTDPTRANPPAGLIERLGGVEPRFLARTGARVDTGHWGWSPRLWVAVTDESVHLYAPGKAPYARTIPLAALAGSFYNHVTAAVVLAGEDAQPLHTLPLEPVRGRALLESLRREPAHA